MKENKQTIKPFATRKAVGISMALTGLLLLVIVAGGETLLGGFGKAVANFFFGIFGLTAYAVLAALAAAGVFIAAKMSVTMPKWQMVNLFVLFAAIVLLVQTINTSKSLINPFNVYLAECYAAAPVTFGGALSGIFVWPLYNFVDWCAYVILAMLLLANVYIASDFFVAGKGKILKQKKDAAPREYEYASESVHRRPGMSVFTVNNSFEPAPPKMQSYATINHQPMGYASAASILFSDQKEPSLYSSAPRTPYASSGLSSTQKSAFEQLYGKLDDNIVPKQSYNADFESSLSEKTKQYFNTAPTSQFLNADAMPPKIMHEEGLEAKTDNAPIDIAKNESKFLKKDTIDKQKAAKQLEMLKGKGGFADMRPLDPPKRPQSAQAWRDSVKQDFKSSASTEQSSYKPEHMEPFLEDSYLSHQDKILQRDIETGERQHIEIESAGLFAPFVRHEESGDPIEDIAELPREEARSEYESISNTELSSDDELNTLLTSMTSLLNNTQKMLGKDDDETEEDYEDEIPEPPSGRIANFQRTVQNEFKQPSVQEEPVPPKPKPVHKYKKYVAPVLDLLDRPALENLSYNENYDLVARQIEEVLAEFRIEARAVNYVSGPSVTLYEFELARGVSVKKILPLADDIAMRVSSKGGNVRIQAPIMGKNLFGIEVPNRHTKIVMLRSVLESNDFRVARGNLVFALGPNIQGENIVPDLSDMPHLLIGGATGFGKSVCLNCLIVSMMYRYSPEELRFIFVDPKQVELTMYNGLPHMLLPEVVTEPEKAIKTFDWLVNEMERRFNLFKEIKVGDIVGYNAKIDPETTQKLPRVVLVVDELANLMTYNKNEIENKILRLSQKARAAGIHLVLATQRPSKDVITGDIKVNLPCRIALKVVTVNDSRTIFPQGGPEKLAGKGDMLFLTGALPEPVRLQGAYISKEEVERVVSFVKENNEAYFDGDVADEILKEKVVKNTESSGESSDLDPYFWDVLKYCIEKKQASISMVQRRFKMGYNRAGKIIVDMERMKFISEQVDAKPRQVFITMEEYEQLFEEK